MFRSKNYLLREKIGSTSGTARLVILLAVIAAVLAAVIAVPVAGRVYEARLEADDEEYRIAAERMAAHEYLDGYEGEMLVYDSVRKRFVEPERVDGVEHYASSRLHADDYLVAIVGADGDVMCEWLSADDIRRLSARKR